MAWYQEALDRIESRVTTRQVETRFGHTHLIEAGPEEGSPVVLLPGWGANGAIFFCQIDSLAQQNYRVFAIDTIGQAGRSAPKHLDTDSVEYAIWLTDLFESLGIEQAHLIGITGGGWLALRFAVHDPSRVLSLALISPMGIAPYKRLPIKTIVLLLAFALLPIKPLVGAYMRLHTVQESEISEFGGEMLRLFFRHYRVLSLPWPPLLSSDMLRRITAPVLVLFAEEDVYFDPFKAAGKAQTSLPQAQVEVVPKMGHLMIFDQPERLNQRLLTFLRTNVN